MLTTIQQHLSNLHGDNSPTTTSTLSPDLRRKIDATLADYPSVEQLMLAFEPSQQRLAAADPDRTLLDNSPSLLVLRHAYGSSAPQMWLLPQILNLVVYTNSRGTLPADVAEDLAAHIAIDFPRLTLSQLLLFFFRFKSGRYGRFYGTVDPMVITMALDKFADECAAALSRLDEQRRQQQREALPGPPLLRLEDYAARHGVNLDSDDNNAIQNFINSQLAQQ